MAIPAPWRSVSSVRNRRSPVQAAALALGVLLAALLVACGGPDRDGEYITWRDSDPDSGITMQVRENWLQRQRGSEDLDVQFLRHPDAPFAESRGIQLVFLPDPRDCGLACLAAGLRATGEESAVAIAGATGLQQDFRRTVSLDGEDAERAERWTLLVRDGQALLMVAFYPLGDDTILDEYAWALDTLRWPLAGAD